MRIKLVFEDWRKKGRSSSIYNTRLGMSLSMGDLHSGTTLDAQLLIDDPEIEREISAAYKDHKAYAVFRVIPEP